MFSFHSGSSRTTSARSITSDVSFISDTLHIKVVHNTAIILLRVHRSISFEEARSKIYEKFVTQEGVPLSESFALAFLPPAPIDYSKPRPRSDSMSSSVGFPDLAHMRFISSQREWEQAVASIGRQEINSSLYWRPWHLRFFSATLAHSFYCFVKHPTFFRDRLAIIC